MTDSPPVSDSIHFALAAVAHPSLRGTVAPLGMGLIAAWRKAGQGGAPDWQALEPHLWTPVAAHLIRAEPAARGLDLRMVGPAALLLAELEGPGILGPTPARPPHRLLLDAAGQRAPLRVAARGLELIALPLTLGAILAVFRAVGRAGAG